VLELKNNNTYSLGHSGSDPPDLTCSRSTVLLMTLIHSDRISSVQFSSVQFAMINVVLSAKHFRTTTQ